MSGHRKSAAGEQRVLNKRFMKKKSAKPENEMRPEYDFASMKGGVIGKYAQQYRAGTNLVLLDPKLARALPADAGKRREGG